MELTVVDIADECLENVLWLPRSCTFNGVRVKSGHILCLRVKASEERQHVAAKVRLFSPGSDISRENLKHISLASSTAAACTVSHCDCVLSSSLSRALRTSKGEVLVVSHHLTSASVPRAKLVRLTMAWRTHSVGQYKRSVLDHRRLSGTEIGQALLGEYATVGQSLTLLKNGHQISVIVASIVPFGDGQLLESRVAKLNEETDYVFEESSFCVSRARARLKSCDIWAPAVCGQIAGVDATVNLLIERFHCFVNNICNPTNLHNLAPALTAGVLLSGRSGTGKTRLARAFAENSGVSWNIVNCADFLKFSEGDAELYLHSMINVPVEGPHIVVLDDLDAIASTGPKQAAQGMARRIYAVLTSLLDPSLSSAHLCTALNDTPKGGVFIIGVTNRLHNLDPGLLRSGRLDQVLEMDIVDARQRYSILRYLCKELPMDPNASDDMLRSVSEATHGFVGADLESLCHTAFMHWQRNTETQKHITLDHFLLALKTVKPANLLELTAQVPKRHFSDLFGLEDVIKHVQTSVLRPFKHLDRYAALGINPPRGVLLHGPAGVGKSVLSYALVQEAGFNCIYVDGPKIRSKVVGESEQNITKIFAQARSSAPSILLIDQIDMLVPRRGMDMSSENTGERIVTCFLTEMDGVLSKSAGADNRTVFIIAVTNRPDVIDAAILRPGRLDEHIYIPPPNAEARHKIFQGFLSRIPNNLETTDLCHLAQLSDGYTGADIENVCREAALSRLRIDLTSEMIGREDLLAAMESVRRNMASYPP
ncbi:uncharacterized protein SPPG_03371 [Spizellomyces punctatus DAOM BR117]|uniref:AAA+ ATPase domain-containing protein n=1 Tax=Spizellomyces punctatus (strain DAOM BR117) TaxID=645134 RepID=A0A0L0HJF1_SPIPD|nr:uncharacterized protein SPPG_03371 [Spizellomyces punctatus DAOM BR117]KND01571.1 hypothetical protein SPPG_03371 [Spizellomyces punctatus DAOM BR117]|eukprot:XP_016609610.1 hypothetical protein SPPG_03371 [Spizellomyces punctatus DAOM BR117]